MTKRNKLFAILSLIACAVLSCILAVIAALASSVVADAYTSSSSGYTATKPEDEIYNEENDSFSNENLLALCQKLLSSSTAGDASLEQAVQNVRTGLSVGSGTTPLGLANRNIIVRFGGIDWVVVAASTPMAGGSATRGNQPASSDVIITLWQAVATKKAKWNLASNTYSSTDGNYPANMYGTSYMRSQVLSNGGQYRQNDVQLQGSNAQPNGDYYKFANASGAMQKYIVAPAHISWQKTQRAVNYYSNYNSPNDAWGTGMGSWFSDEFCNFDFESKPNYSVWKNDLVWLPSTTETGYDPPFGAGWNGMWNTTAAVRASTASTSTWLRDAYSINYGPNSVNILLQVPQGTSASLNTDVTNDCLVRPAIHLNLTAAARAAGAAKPAEKDRSATFNYDGLEHKLDLGLGHPASATIEVAGESVSYVRDGYLTATAAGVYTVTAQPKDDFTWVGEDNDREKITYTLTINKADFSVTNVADEVFSADTSGHKHVVDKADRDDGYLLDVPINAIVKSASTVPDIVYYTYGPEESSDSLGSQPADGWTEEPTLATAEGYYRVYYKISDPDGNYYDFISYFDVHVYAHEMYAELGDGWTNQEFVYGSAGHTSEELYEQLKDYITHVYLLDGTDVKDTEFNLEHFDFFLEDENGVRQEWNKLLPVGTYRLRAESNQTNELVTIYCGDFNNRGESVPPVYRIVPKEITFEIEDDGHEYGQEPKLTQIVVKEYGDDVFVGDDSFEILGEILPIIKQGDSVFTLDKYLNTGTYVLSAEGGVIGNYLVTFIDGVYTVDKATVTVTIPYDPATDNIFTSTPALPDGVAVYLGEAVEGTFTWVDVEYPLAEGTYTYHWTWEPADSVNYNPEEGEVEITVIAVDLKEIEAVFNQGDNVFYTSTKFEDVEALIKSLLTVTGINNDGSRVDITFGFEISGSFETAGTVTWIVTYDEMQASFSVNVTAVALDHITVEWAESAQGDAVFYYHELLESLDGLKAHFKVTGVNNDGSTFTVAEYSLSADLAPSYATVTVSYEGKTADIGVLVTDKYAEEKDQAKKDLEKKAEEEKGKVDQDPDLSDEEKKKRKDEIDEELKKAKDAVDRAGTPGDIADALENGMNSLKGVTPKPREVGSVFVILGVEGAAVLGLAVAVIVMRKKKVR